MAVSQAGYSAMKDIMKSGTVTTSTRFREFIERLAPRADLTLDSGAAAGLPVRTRQGHAVSLLRCQDANYPQMERAIRRGLPTIVIAEHATPPPALAAMPSGWQATRALTAPTITVLLGEIEEALQADVTAVGADLVARISSREKRGRAGQADMTACSPGGLADAIDDALTTLSGSLKKDTGASGLRLSRLVPLSPGEPYAMEPVLDELLDGAYFVEVARPAAAELTTGFSTFRGSPVAVLASRPDHDHGRLTLAGIRRIARFLALVDRLGIPLLSVVDSAGVRWDVRPDSLEILRDSLLAMHNLSVPKFVLLAGNAFGTAAPLLGIGMRTDLMSAWPRGRIAADHNVDADRSSVLSAARAGLALDVIHPDETYKWLQDLITMTTGAQAPEAFSA
jgi:hypothetical protein